LQPRERDACLLFVKAFHMLRPDVLDYPLAFEVCITP
jgi:hypothetical protein